MKVSPPQERLLAKFYRGYGIATHGQRRAAEQRTMRALIDKGLIESIGIGAWVPTMLGRRVLDEAHQRDLASTNHG